MLLETKNFGTLEIKEDKVITFSQGIIAFEEMKRYILIENKDKENPIWWLQSVDRSDLAFPTINPFYFKPDYEFDISASGVEELGIVEKEDVIVLSIVVIPEDLKKMTANLLAPLIINVKTKKGKQLVLQDKNYTTKHYIFAELKKVLQNKEEEECENAGADEEEK